MKQIKVIIPTICYIEVSEQEAEAYMNEWEAESLNEAYSCVAFEKAHQCLMQGMYDDLDAFSSYEI